MAEETEQERREKKILATLKVLAEGLPTLQDRVRCIDATKPEDPRPALAEIIAKATRAGDIATNLHDEQTRPLKTMLDRLNGIWNPLRGGFATVVKDAKRKIEVYVLAEKQRRIAIEQKKTADAAAQAKIQAAAEARAKATTDPAASVVATIEAGRAFAEQERIISEIPEPVETQVKAGGVTMNSTPDWDYEVEDIAAFAVAFPSCIEIRRAETLKVVRLAARENRPVPGLRIVERVRTNVTT